MQKGLKWRDVLEEEDARMHTQGVALMLSKTVTKGAHRMGEERQKAANSIRTRAQKSKTPEE